MKGYIFTICIAMVTTIAFAYNGLEYRGVPSHTSCTGQCYVDYVALNGTPAEMEQRKKALASTDEFSDIRSLWTGCAACHGAEGQGVAVFPKLAGQSQDYIVGRLNAYRNGEGVGAMSSTMWAQAGGLSDAQINMIGKFIEVELK